MLRFADSFDHYATSSIGFKWTSVNNSPAIAATGRNGNGLECTTSDGLSRAVPSAATYVVGMALKTTTMPGNPCGFLVYDDAFGYGQTILALTAAGALRLLRATQDWDVGSAGPSGVFQTEIAISATGIITTNTWYYVEAKFTASSSTSGAYEVRVNGVTVLGPTSSVRTTNSSSTYSQICIGNAGGGGTTYLDDLYVCDTSGGVNDDFLGDVTVEALLPQTDAVAPGSNNSWTCGTSTDHGALVDETPPYTADDTGDYVYTSTLNAYDTWEYPSLSVGTATIHAVQVSTCAKKTDTGAATYVNVARPASTNRDGGATQSPSDSSYMYGIQVWDVNPEDSLAWEVADVNGCEFGVKRTG